jgi:MFS family permease
MGGGRQPARRLRGAAGGNAVSAATAQWRRRLDDAGLNLGFYGFRLLRNAYFHVAIGISYFASVGLSLGDALLLESIYYVSKCLTEVPTGWLADRFGRRICLVASSLTAATGYAMLVLFVGFRPFILAEILLGLSMSLASGADSALVYDALAATRRLEDYRRIEGRGWAMRNLGYGAASAVGSLIAARYGLGLPFLVSSAFIILSLPFLALMGGERGVRRGTDPAAAGTPALGLLLRNRSFLFVLLFFSLLFVYVRIGFWAFQPALIEMRVSLSWFGPLFCLTLGVALLAGVRTDLIRTTPLGMIGLLTLPILAFLVLLAAGVRLGGAGGLAVALLGFALHAVVQGIYDPIMRDWVNTFCAASCRATTLSLASMLGNLGFAAVAPLFGRAVEHFGTAPVALAAALILLAGQGVLLHWAAHRQAIPSAEQLARG